MPLSFEKNGSSSENKLFIKSQLKIKVTYEFSILLKHGFSSIISLSLTLLETDHQQSTYFVFQMWIRSTEKKQDKQVNENKIEQIDNSLQSIQICGNTRI